MASADVPNKRRTELRKMLWLAAIPLMCLLIVMVKTRVSLHPESLSTIWAAAPFRHGTDVDPYA
ncbi:MAG TPA: hypothetical protein VGI59_08565, partial [Candidatus Udaeobacter sp.]